MITRLDEMILATQADPEDAMARMRFYEDLADTMLVMLLAEVPQDDDDINPEVVEVDDAPYILVFDREERLADFADRQASYAELSGRSLVQVLAGQNIGMGINLGQAASFLMPPEAVQWLAEMLAVPVEHTPENIEEFYPPSETLCNFLMMSDRKMAQNAVLAQAVYLARARYKSGEEGHVVCFVDAKNGAEDALAKSIQDSLAFSGLPLGALDVMFAGSAHPVLKVLDRAGVRVDLPEPAKPHVPGAFPGMDPDKPPKLR